MQQKACARAGGTCFWQPGLQAHPLQPGYDSSGDGRFPRHPAKHRSQPGRGISVCLPPDAPGGAGGVGCRQIELEFLRRDHGLDDRQSVAKPLGTTSLEFGAFHLRPFPSCRPTGCLAKCRPRAPTFRRCCDAWEENEAGNRLGKRHQLFRISSSNWAASAGGRDAATAARSSSVKSPRLSTSRSRLLSR